MGGLAFGLFAAFNDEGKCVAQQVPKVYQWRAVVVHFLHFCDEGI